MALFHGSADCVQDFDSYSNIFATWIATGTGSCLLEEKEKNIDISILVSKRGQDLQKWNKRPDWTVNQNVCFFLKL